MSLQYLVQPVTQPSHTPEVLIFPLTSLPVPNPLLPQHPCKAEIRLSLPAEWTALAPYQHSSTDTTSSFRVLPGYDRAGIVLYRRAQRRTGSVTVLDSCMEHVPESEVARITELATALWDRLKFYFQEERRLPDIVLYCTHGSESQCSGNGVLLNVAEACEARDVASREANLMSLLAHELAHAWWLFTVRWSSRELSFVANEAFAEFYEWLTCMQVGGPDLASRIDRRRLWAIIRALLHPQERHPDRYFGYCAALVLRGLYKVHGDALVRALSAVREYGRHRVLSVTDVRGAVEQHCGSECATVVASTLRDPSPLLVSMRVTETDQVGLVSIAFKGSRKVLDRLEERFRAIGVKGRRSSASTLSVDCTSVHQMDELLRLLVPFLVLSRRAARDLVLSLFSRLGPLRSAIANADEWRADSARIGQSSRARVIRRLKVAVLGFCGILLNPEAPSGFALLADAVEGVSPRACYRLRRAATARAIYRAELRTAQNSGRADRPF